MYLIGPFRRSLAVAMTIFASAFLTAGVLRAAEMERVPAGKVDFIFIKGAITEGDAHKFGQLATETDQHKLVFLDSPGGLVDEGLDIGMVINRFGMATAVGPNGSCASVCALMWVAGATRYLEGDGRIGFHAAYSLGADGAQVSAEGNAKVGYYLSSIGLAPHIVSLVTAAAPEDMAWMHADDVVSAGIAVVSVAAMGNPSDSKPRPWARTPHPFPDGSNSPSPDIASVIAPQAFARVNDVIRDKGMVGAQAFSTSCWATVRSKDDPIAMEACFLFDAYASAMDNAATRALGVEPMAFFKPVQISTRLLLFMKKHGYTPAQVDEMLQVAMKASAHS